MFVLLAFLILVALVLACMSGGTTHAIRTGWVCSLIVPSWVVYPVGALNLDLRMVAVIILIPIALIGGRWIRRLTLIDGLVLMLLGVAAASLQHSDTFSASEFLAIIGSLLLPYFFGRLLIGSLADLRALVPSACAGCMVLSLFSIFESTTKINPINLVAQRYGSLNSETNNRMNLRRAEGPFGHPIYLGMSLALLFPWTLEAARLARKKRLHWMYLAAPMLCLLGVFGTVSRGPILVVAASAMASLFFAVPRLRIPVIAASAGAMLLALTAWPLVIEQLESFSGEKAKYKVSIDGREFEYTGTRHRELLYAVYDKALIDAGLLGHGKWRAKESHEALVEPHLRQSFQSIDNHYILLVLNWGKVGFIVFVTFGLFAIASGGLLALMVDQNDRLLIGGLTGSVAGVMVLLVSVWLANDYGFYWLASIGMIGSVWAARSREKSERRSARPSPTARAQMFPLRNEPARLPRASAKLIGQFRSVSDTDTDGRFPKLESNESNISGSMVAH